MDDGSEEEATGPDRPALYGLARVCGSLWVRHWAGATPWRRGSWGPCACGCRGHLQGSVEGPVAAVVEPITHGQPGLGLVARRGLRTTDPAFRVFR